MGEAAKVGKAGVSRGKGAASKGRKSRPASGDGKVEVKVTISAEVRRRLGVHCELSGETMGDFADRVLGARLRERGQGRSLFGDVETPASDDGEPESAAA